MFKTSSLIDHLHELFNRVWIVEVSALGHMPHEQVMPHQGLNLLSLVRIESQAVKGPADKGCSLR